VGEGERWYKTTWTGNKASQAACQRACSPIAEHSGIGEKPAASMKSQRLCSSRVAVVQGSVHSQCPARHNPFPCTMAQVSTAAHNQNFGDAENSMPGIWRSTHTTSLSPQDAQRARGGGAILFRPESAGHLSRYAPAHYFDHDWIHLHL
jgi:hypothetical protein